MRFLIFSFLLIFGLVQAQTIQTEARKPKVAVILSGGGARSIAYLGALQTLVEAGVPVDLIVGTSGGALVGGLYASGYSFETIEKILQSLKPSEVLRPQFPPTEGLIDLKPLEIIYRQIVAESLLENTSPRLAITATKLAPSDKAFIDNGDLTAAVRASISIPLLFPPAEVNGDRYIDGGVKVLTSKAIAIAKELGADFVIFLGPKRQQKDTLSFNDVIQLALVSLAEPERAEPTDAALTIEVSDAIFLDFSQASQLIKRGRQAMEQELAPLLAKLKTMDISLNAPGDPHRYNQINQNWQSQLSKGLALADSYQPFYLLPEVAIGPSSYHFGTRLTADGLVWALGLQAGLGPWHFSLGYSDRFGQAGSGFYTNFGYRYGNLAAWLTFDPLRRPIDSPWETGAGFIGQNSQIKLFFDQVAANLAISQKLIFDQLSLELSSEVRFSYKNAWNIIGQVEGSYEINPINIRASFLAGFATEKTLSIGASSRMRAYPNGFLMTDAVGIGNFELGYSFENINLLGLAGGDFEIKSFLDLAFDKSNFLWDFGIGAALDGRAFGLLPVYFGLDLAYAPNNFRFNFFTESNF